MVTQMYTFNSWSKQKSMGGGLPYVGFPGLSLTPIQESPLLMDSILNDEMDRSERQKWLLENSEHDTWDPHDMKNGSLPKHWVDNGIAKQPRRSSSADLKGTCNGDIEAGKPQSSSKTSSSSSSNLPPPKSCALNVHVVRTTTFLPKEQPMSVEQKRAHICKLLLFALCGFVIVAGIVLWIFSPAFT
ncbi:hypothetical protein V1264_012449 [Littorina saxatilis]